MTCPEAVILSITGSEMASTSSTEALPSSSTTAEELRPEAGPLPRKRGELGYQEEIHGQSVPIPEPEVASLPARHPADRDAPPAEAAAPSPPSPEPSTSSDASSTNSMCKRKGLLAFFKRKKVPSFGGIRLSTLFVFLIQLCIFGGTIAAWVVCVHSVMQRASMNSASSAIFIHVVFGVAVVGQLLFLERRIFLIRAERYAYLHPGEILPSARTRLVDQSIAFSPWNRPPLPTYAAALAQSGVGTGDAEDNMIAVIPPPAYGNTRGSRLLLTGYLNDTQRAERPISAMTQMSQQGDRPISYMSRDDEWEVIQDAHRSMQLEATLASLERPSSRTVR